MAVRRRNKFDFESFLSDVEKDLLKSERKTIARAASVMMSELKKSIKSKDLVEEGNLLKGVKRDAYVHTVLVGIAAPGYHAAIVEYGSEERFSEDGHGSGRMPAIPFFLPAYRLALPRMKKVLTEEW